MSHAAYPKNIKHVPLYRYLWNITRRMNGNAILNDCGLPGSSKSWTALKIMYDLNINTAGKRLTTIRNPLQNVAFTADDFAQLVEKSKRYSVLVWEEASTMPGANARRFWEKRQQWLSSLFQVMRFKNQIAILTFPVNAYLDKQLRMLFHGSLVMEGHNNFHSWGKFKLNQLNPEVGEIYRKYPRHFGKDNELIVSDKIMFLPPPKWLTKAYEKKQQEWKNALIQQVNLELGKERQDFEEGKKSTDSFALLKNVRENVKRFYNERLGKVEASKIIFDEELRGKFSFNDNKAYHIARLLNQEGVRP